MNKKRLGVESRSVAAPVAPASTAIFSKSRRVALRISMVTRVRLRQFTTARASRRRAAPFRRSAPPPAMDHRCAKPRRSSVVGEPMIGLSTISARRSSRTDSGKIDKPTPAATSASTSICGASWTMCGVKPQSRQSPSEDRKTRDRGRAERTRTAHSRLQLNATRSRIARR